MEVATLIEVETMLSQAKVVEVKVIEAKAVEVAI